jgi:GNAT superfamily N-acetyltransferase
MNIEIRKGESKDFVQVFALIKEFAIFITTPEKVLTSAEQMEADKDFFQCYVALDGDKVIGFATYFFAYYSWSGKAIYLDDLYVKESYRRLGIGTKFFDTILETGKKANCKKLKWQVSNWNNKAIEFYKKRGADIDDVEINCDLSLN